MWSTQPSGNESTSLARAGCADLPPERTLRLLILCAWLGAMRTLATQQPQQPHINRRSAIEQGWSATVQEFPYAAMVMRPDDGKYLCTGTLVHPRVVLTAAHCVTPALEGRPNPTVNLGRDGLSQRAGFEQFKTRSFTHPRFRPGSFDFDIAALVLDRPSSAKAARLVKPGATLGVPAQAPDAPTPYQLGQVLAASDGEPLSLVVLGWGATEAGGLPNQLQQGRVSPVPLETCAKAFDEFGTRVSPRMVCVTGRTCAGDSGGPLLLPDGNQGLLLVGQVSFGYPRRGGQQGCPRPNPVTAFTDLSAPRIRDWLQQVVLDRVDVGPGNTMRASAQMQDGGGAQQQLALATDEDAYVMEEQLPYIVSGAGNYGDG